MTKGRTAFMSTLHEHGEFVSFMGEYVAFLGQMCADEKGKLSALSSKELARIERSIATSQANAKQLENMEKKRMDLQQAAGYEGMTFRRLISAAPQSEQDALWKLFSLFEGTVAEIRFYNDKSMAVARDNMTEIDPGVVLGKQSVARVDNPYERMREGQREQSKILETKV